MAKKIKVCHIVMSFEVGGVETLVLQLCNALDKDKFEVHLIPLTRDKLRLVNLLEEDVIVNELGMSEVDLKTFKGFFKGALVLTRLLKNIKPDLVHSHLYFSSLLLTAIAIRFTNNKILHFRTVHTAGGFYENTQSFINKTRLFIEQLAMKINNTYIISVSNIVQQNNLKFFRRSSCAIEIIHNGIDLNRYHLDNFLHVTKSNFEIPNEAIVITYVARLESGKNHDFMIEVFDQIIKKIPNAILCIAGDGILRERLESNASTRGLDSSVKFLGLIDNVSGLLSISDIAVFPSSFEGFSLVLLEKMAMGLPVVASNIKPFGEVIDHGVNGYILPLYNKEEFTGCIVKLCADRVLREEIGENARISIQSFSIEKTIELHEQYYIKSFLKARMLK